MNYNQPNTITNSYPNWFAMYDQLPALIGRQEFKGEAKYINDPASEWFIPDAQKTMPAAMLYANAKKLSDQLDIWNGHYANTRKRKDIKNLDIIIGVQSAKLDAYEILINQLPAAPGSAAIKPLPGSAAIKPEAGSAGIKTPILIGAGILLLLMLKK